MHRTEESNKIDEEESKNITKESNQIDTTEWNMKITSIVSLHKNLSLLNKLMDSDEQSKHHTAF